MAHFYYRETEATQILLRPVTRMRVPQIFFAAACVFLALTSIGCGGGGSKPNVIAGSGTNVQSIVVNSGPAGNYINGVFTSVTVCVPSTTNCQTIDGVLVDTGSYGLRLLSSTGGGALTLNLPRQTASGGNTIGECAPFLTGVTWGSVATADLTISGETANNLPVQVIDPTFAALPSECAAFDVPEQDTLTGLGSNGILGVGPLVQDCGTPCGVSGSSNPGLYYSCASTSCTVYSEPVAQQVQNPVALFATDNNGVIVELPQTSSAATVTGSLVFGIGTQSNNGLGSATVLGMNSNLEFNTGFKGQSYPGFIDSGSNGLYFLDSATLQGLGVTLPACPYPNPDFYCPGSQINLSATNTSGTGSTSSSVDFSIADADTLFSSSNFVFSTLGGENPGTFDWGLPFFFGRNVFTAINGQNTPGGPGPYWAF